MASVGELLEQGFERVLVGDLDVRLVTLYLDAFLPLKSHGLPDQARFGEC
jgi:hypothetical protein